MKKIPLMLLVLVTLTGSLSAQNVSEWTQQKKTQKKYLLQQIAALQVYIEYLQRGYKIVKEGLNTISEFKRGEFNLHRTFFNSLKKVNPAVRRYAKVADIIALQHKILQDYNRNYNQFSTSNAFTAEELTYIRGVFGRLLEDCESTLDELLAVTTDDQLDMKDNERMARIDKLYLGMQEKYTFSQAFHQETKTLAAARAKEQNDVQTSRALRGIN